jgi:hypothetical protein
MKSRPLKFLGYDWKVKITENSKYLGADDGGYSWKTKTIYIRKSITHEEQMSTLYHECHHIIIDHFRLTIPDEEHVVLTLENAMIAVIKDNQLDFR